jgi:hypothetical protein
MADEIVGLSSCGYVAPYGSLAKVGMAARGKEEIHQNTDIS